MIRDYLCYIRFYIGKRIRVLVADEDVMKLILTKHFEAFMDRPVSDIHVFEVCTKRTLMPFIVFILLLFLLYTHCSLILSIVIILYYLIL